MADQSTRLGCGSKRESMRTVGMACLVGGLISCRAPRRAVDTGQEVAPGAEHMGEHGRQLRARRAQTREICCSTKLALLPKSSGGSPFSRSPRLRLCGGAGGNCGELGWAAMRGSNVIERWLSVLLRCNMKNDCFRIWISDKQICAAGHAHSSRRAPAAGIGVLNFAADALDIFGGYIWGDEAVGVKFAHGRFIDHARCEQSRGSAVDSRESITLGIFMRQRARHF